MVCSSDLHQQYQEQNGNETKNVTLDTFLFRRKTSPSAGYYTMFYTPNEVRNPTEEEEESASVAPKSSSPSLHQLRFSSIDDHDDEKSAKNEPSTFVKVMDVIAFPERHISLPSVSPEELVSCGCFCDTDYPATKTEPRQSQTKKQTEVTNATAMPNNRMRNGFMGKFRRAKASSQQSSPRDVVTLGREVYNKDVLDFFFEDMEETLACGSSQVQHCHEQGELVEADMLDYVFENIDSVVCRDNCHLDQTRFLNGEKGSLPSEGCSIRRDNSLLDSELAPPHKLSESCQTEKEDDIVTNIFCCHEKHLQRVKKTFKENEAVRKGVSQAESSSPETCNANVEVVLKDSDNGRVKKRRLGRFLLTFRRNSVKSKR